MPPGRTRIASDGLQGRLAYPTPPEAVLYTRCSKSLSTVRRSRGFHVGARTPHTCLRPPRGGSSAPPRRRRRRGRRYAFRRRWSRPGRSRRSAPGTPRRNSRSSRDWVQARGGIPRSRGRGRNPCSPSGILLYWRRARYTPRTITTPLMTLPVVRASPKSSTPEATPTRVTRYC